MMPGLRITYRGVTPTDAIDDYVRRRAEKLTRRGRTISSCRVVIDTPHRHKRHGRAYTVHIEVATAARRFVVDHAPGDGQGVEDLYAAIDAGFDHAVRRLDEDVARLAGSERGS
ncbi:MAG TPA: HPF/RaiA family ribosome-associated protein [Polyangiaceae bacterium]|nr:HPF/RaiA family ribosome-associated protein [Polyangiaceae bacterium]